MAPTDPRQPPVQEVEFEVLPPESAGTPREVEPLFRWLALFMDNLFRVPGTNFRIGLDPIIGLVPGIGDTGSALISAMALVKAARMGLPKIILARMAVNILVNQIGGFVPLFGDAFSAWFKSNARNYKLLQEHAGPRRKSNRSDWIFVVGVLLLLGTIVLVGLALSLFIIQQLLRLLGLA
ncbi:hypothetical protein BH20VER1_BH20VER1_13740 [soil metagenome]